MAIYYRGLGLPWGQYLALNQCVEDINGTVRKLGDQISYVIPQQAKEIIASNEALSRTFCDKFNEVNGTISEGFDIIGQKIDNISQGIETLNATFNYGIILLVKELEVQTKLMNNILEKLDSIYQTLKSPTLTQAREFYNIGRDRFRKGLLCESLESFKKAEEKNNTDFLTQYYLGHLYLYGKNEDYNVIDLTEAEKHFRNAAKYASTEFKELPEAKKFYGESYFHLSVLYFIVANEKFEKGENADEVEHVTKDSAKAAKKAIEIYPELSVSFYQYAKACALLKNKEEAIKNLEIAIRIDRNYCIKATIDKDFDNIRTDILKLFERLRREAEKEANRVPNKIRELLDSYIYSTKDAKQAMQKINELLKDAKQLYRGGTYFDYLEVIECLNNTKYILDSFVPNKFLRTLKNEYGLSNGQTHSISFSPDGHYLASSGGIISLPESEVGQEVEIWEIPSGNIKAALKGHDWVTSVSFSPDGHFLASGRFDGIIEIWEIPAFQNKVNFRAHEDITSFVCFSPDGHYLAAGGNDGMINLWEVPTFQKKTSFFGYRDEVMSISFSPDGHYLAAGTLDSQELQISDIYSGGKNYTLQVPAMSVSFSPDGRYLALGSGKKGGEIWLVEVPSWNIKFVLQGHSDFVQTLSFSPDGRYLASGSWDNTLCLWDINLHKKIYNKIFDSGLCAVSFSPDKQYLAAVAWEDLEITLLENPIIRKEL